MRAARREEDEGKERMTYWSHCTAQLETKLDGETGGERAEGGRASLVYMSLI
jgi:hypothetical protein